MVYRLGRSVVRFSEKVMAFTLQSPALTTTLPRTSGCSDGLFFIGNHRGRVNEYRQDLAAPNICCSHDAEIILNDMIGNGIDTDPWGGHFPRPDLWREWTFVQGIY